MTVEDYYDALAFRTELVPPPVTKWADELRWRFGIESFRGIG